jgi:dTDP-L-rhamnose 4-epimerase
MTRVLVTGGAGFIGSHTVDALLARGYDVRVLDALLPPVHDGTIPSYVPSEVEFVRADVRDRQALREALDGVAIVYHLAAYQDYLPDFSTFFTTNAGSTALLYELIVAERRGVELVVVASSQAVYGEGRYECACCGAFYPGPRQEEQLVRGGWEIRCPSCGGEASPAWTDERVMNPHNSYGMSKRDQDDIAVHLGRRYSVPSVAFRYSIVQGVRQSFRNAYSGALRSFTVQMGAGLAPVVYEDGRQLRDYVGVEDVVRANLAPLDHPAMAGQSFNVGGNRSVTVLALAELVARTVGRAAEIAPSGLYRVGDTRHIRSDVGRLQAHGWGVAEELPDVVRRYVEWALEAPGFQEAGEPARRRMQDLGVVRSVRVT